MNKKSQSAMEYLMTYGWAILVVLIALGALFYLGVFSPSTPTVCSIAAPFSCTDLKISNGGTDNMIIGASGIQNGATITITGDCTTATPSTLNNGETTVVLSSLTAANCQTAPVGSKVAGEISISYTLTGSSLSHTAKGTYSTTAEA